MADGMNIHIILQASLDGFDVNSGGRQQRFAQALAAQLIHWSLQICVLHIEHFTDQREAVGVYAGGGQTDQHITFCQFFAVDDLFFVYDTNREACQIVFIHRIETGHFGSFTANQSTFCLTAAFGDTGDDISNTGRIILAASNIVQEEHGTCTAADDIIDAHSHTVDTDGVMLVHQEGQLQLSTNTIGTGNQNRLLHAGHIGSKHTAKATKSTHNAGDIGTFHHGLDAANCLITGSHVYASRGVGSRMRIIHFSLFLSIPTIGAYFITIDTDGFQQAVQ